MSIERKRAPRNRTLTLSAAECETLWHGLLYPDAKINVNDFCNRVMCGDLFENR